VPADGSFNQNGQETPQIGGGNPRLGPEDARTFTMGLTYRPTGLPDFVASVDYYDIQIENGILSLGANSILEQCLATGQPQFCEKIERDGEGSIVQVNAQLQNVATETAKGVDLELFYGHQGLGGGFSHRLMVSYVSERDLIAFPGAEPFAGAGGYDPDNFGAIPRWRAKYALTWDNEDWRLGYKAQWIGSVDESGGELYPGTVNPVAGQLYHDAFGGYAFSPAVSLTGGVENLTDETPPFFANADEANTDVATYRLLGRTYWLRLDLRID
jgi:outer membrane receptor protein involved in Fe transport